MAYIPNQEPVGAWTKILTVYRRDAGSWAYIFHRASGVALTVYLFVHIWALTGLTEGRAAFQEEMALFTTLPFKVLEWLIGVAVMFHALNGIRIAIVDLSEGARYHKKLLTFVYIIGIAVMLAMFVLIFQEDLGIHLT
jgi:succinate dehydrogenase / fumarate reductase, cytochrome b subunit